MIKKLGISTIIAAVLGILVTTLPASAQSVLEKVKEAGVVNVGVRKDLPHFGFTDESGQIQGFDIDIARAVAERLGVDMVMEPVTTQTRVPMLQQGRIDMIVATLTHYRRRDDAIDFSIGYFKDTGSVLVRKDSGIATLADLAGKRVGSTTGTQGAEKIKELLPDVVVQTFEGYPESFVAMEQGLVDGVVTDVIMLSGLRANARNPEDFVFITGENSRFGGGEYAIGVIENDSKWRDAVNHALMDIWEDGTWDQIFNKWLGPDSELGVAKEDLGWSMNVTSP